MTLGKFHERDLDTLPREDQKVVQKAMNLFFLLFLGVGFVLGGGAAVFYSYHMRSFLKDLKLLESHSLELQYSAMANELDHIVSDLLFLAGQSELILHLDSGDEKLISDMQREYIRMAASKKVYAQIRFLDGNGMEKARVNAEAGHIKPTPPNQLQYKGDRYYFRQSYALEERDIYISPLDLNIENGQVERPLKPMMRFGTPAYDSAGQKKGVIIINYTAAALLKRVLDSGGTAEGVTMLMNSKGYWLINPDKDKEWGFMFTGRTRDTFAREYPDEWQKMLTTRNGQFQTRNGLFTFKTFYPLEEGHRFLGLDELVDSGSGESDSQQHFMLLLSHVPPDTMDGYIDTLLFKLFLGGGALFIMIAFGAWHLALAISRRRMYQAQLIALAMYDSLTGLPNRKLFFDRLTAGIATARRYERKLALLYIDLDGFKEVNDTRGHEAGDELLTKVGKTLSGAVRKTDTVARLGGDEFAIILGEIPSVKEAALVGEKIVLELCRPFNLKSGTVEIGGSIGVAVFPDHEDTEKGLLKSADQAMYESKAKGKNTCTVTTAPKREP